MGSPAAAVDDEAHQSSRSGLGDDGDFRDDDDGVGAQLAIGGFHQVDAFIADRNGDVQALPAIVRGYRPLPHGDDLLLVQHRHLRESFDVRARLLLAAAHLPQANLVADIR